MKIVELEFVDGIKLYFDRNSELSPENVRLEILGEMRDLSDYSERFQRYAMTFIDKELDGIDRFLLEYLGEKPLFRG